MNKAVDKLESVIAAFGHWRETRTSQGKISDYLWEQVKELFAIEYGRRLNYWL
ncbi:hypothetical protein [Legionella sp. km772]|uniref:hypothetical protein n=1 Tax=Legionella sp. km772 TaxID=2498111 RepID=UPI0018F54DEC|nr:hypothetical protein [Legionella sp. km772]